MIVFAFVSCLLTGQASFKCELYGRFSFVMALVSIANFCFFLAGWASANPYSSIGAARVLTQFLGYDIPLLLLAVAPAFLAGSLTISS